MIKSYLRLVNNTLLLGAFVKGKGSSRRLKYKSGRAQAYAEADNQLPLRGYVRSHSNPAGYYSQIPQRPNRGAVKK